jgi:hypothetical protein
MSATQEEAAHATSEKSDPSHEIAHSTAYSVLMRNVESIRPLLCRTNSGDK